MPVTTTLLDKSGGSVGGLLFGFILDVGHCVLHCADLLSVFIRDVDIERFFERHHQFDYIQGIRAEIVDKGRGIIYLRLIDTKLLNDDLLHLLCNGHESSKVALKALILAPRFGYASFTLKQVMSVVWLSLLAASVMVAQRPSAEQNRAVLARLGTEADRFERNAHRFAALETLRQVQPAGTRFGVGPRGVQTKLPEAVHEIVSEYGFISSDEPGGSLKEVRLVQTVDGLRWKRGKKDLNDLANQIGTRDAKNRGKTLERYEDFGLRGFLSDSGQVILLFARRGVEQYEFSFDREELPSVGGPAWVYRFQQLDGGQAFTIYTGKEPIRQRLRGELWVRASDSAPSRVTLFSEHEANGLPVRDVTMVDYQSSRWGLLLPARIDHKQYVDGKLFVTDEFSYANFKQVQPGKVR